MKQTLKIQKLYDEATIPKNAYTDDAALDLHAAEGFVIPPGERVKVPTGIAFEIPTGYAGLVWDRGSVSVKYGMKTLGGVIDAGFRGEVFVGLLNTSKETYEVKKGDRVAQMLIQRVEHFEVEEVDRVSETDRGENALGSSGK